MANKIVPTIKIRNYLFVPIQIELDDTTMDKLQSQILSEIYEDDSISAIILDVSMVDIIDSYISFSLSEIASMARLMGCHTAICGLQPQVALTLSQMGITLKNVILTRSLEDAIDTLRELQ
ncbi:rsbT antagonist protein RsbS [Caldanaerobius fijiensis DSM 17918]|uniref:RsbT antagonist protein RsbS n=1 Tax=Caldanaerobius fijiensis DSM 17918 TaxID=1121256 RepID=A0A1M5CX32_9THEO|nr:STAS domain-containing protein [Caldanaerobius fijiensis]SHF59308.1 rsbT antagonist protein RsbS [Caldanaerobius fijiensis DSM 17918]